MATNDSTPSQEEFQNAFDATMECVDLLEYLDDSRKGDEWFDEPVEDSDVLDILLPELILSLDDFKPPVPRKAIMAVEQTLARVHSSAVPYLGEWGVSYCDLAWKLCVRRTAAPWLTLGKLIECDPELASLQQSIFFNAGNEESEDLRLKSEQLAISLWDRVVEEMADAPFIDRKRLVAHAIHELVSAGWNRGSTEELDEAARLVREGKKNRQRRKSALIKKKIKFREECEAAIKNGEFTSEARFVDAVVGIGRMSKSNAYQYLKDAKDHCKSSKHLE